MILNWRLSAFRRTKTRFSCARTGVEKLATTISAKSTCLPVAPLLMGHHLASDLEDLIVLQSLVALHALSHNVFGLGNDIDKCVSVNLPGRTGPEQTLRPQHDAAVGDYHHILVGLKILRHIVHFTAPSGQHRRVLLT